MDSSNGGPPRAMIPWLKDGRDNAMEILEITETQIRLKNQVAYRCLNSTADTPSHFRSFEFFNSSAPFVLSSKSNKLFVIGCHDLSRFYDRSDDVIRSCTAKCKAEATNVVAGECQGIGCCQDIIPTGMRSFSVTLDQVQTNNTSTIFNQPCGYAFVGDQEKFKFRGAVDFDDPNFVKRIITDVPMVLDWVVGDHKCAQAQQDRASYACQQNTTCTDATESGIGGYRCSCRPGYQGNPYLTPGCSGLPSSVHKFSLIYHIWCNKQY